MPVLSALSSDVRGEGEGGMRHICTYCTLYPGCSRLGYTAQSALNPYLLAHMIVEGLRIATY